MTAQEAIRRIANVGTTASSHKALCCAFATLRHLAQTDPTQSLNATTVEIVNATISDLCAKEAA